MKNKNRSRRGGMRAIYNFRELSAVIHILCGKPSGEVGGKGREKRRISWLDYGEKSRKRGYPRLKKVVPKVIHNVFHGATKIFIQKSTAPTITTTLINN